MQAVPLAPKHLVMGTAGHVDHGKTSLIKALTGIDTDRLKEEKERGITIDLGFAFLDLDSGERLGIIDVPGHEKFIRNMVAGASGIDFVLLVIAADEGVMPQTREHVSICSFLGITQGIVALTKMDMVEPEWAQMVMADVREYLDTTVLKGSHIIPVSAVTGDGLDDLRAAINSVSLGGKRVDDTGIFRLPVDRVFTVKGFGTVVTGTVISGDVSLASEVVVLPQGTPSRVRTLQTHGKTSERSWRGQRAAINLLNVEKSAITRGTMVAAPSSLYPSRWLDVAINCDDSFPGRVKNKDIVRFHGATSEIMARVTLFGCDEIRAGQSCFAQFYLQAAFPAIAGDRFVIRSCSPVTTVGGGVILDPKSRKLKRDALGVLEELQALKGGAAIERCSVIIKRAGVAGIKIPELVVRVGTHRKEMEAILERLRQNNTIVFLDEANGECVAADALSEVQSLIISRCENYHRQNPLKMAINKEELRTLVGAYVPLPIFSLALLLREKIGEIVVDGNDVRMASHHVRLESDIMALKDAVMKIYADAAQTPPSGKEVATRFSSQAKEFRDVLSLLAGEGKLVRVAEDMYFPAAIIGKIREDYRDFLLAKGKAMPADFRELTGLSRKYMIALMEYFDAAKLTLRVGDARILREKKP